MAQKIECWQSEDGGLYRTKESAENHERRVRFEKWYKKNPLMVDGDGHADYIMDVAEVYAWLDLYHDTFLNE